MCSLQKPITRINYKINPRSDIRSHIMPYQKQVGTPHPGLFIILIDQSGSMNAPFEGGKSRAEVAALVVNRCIQSILQRCKVMEHTKDRCFVVVIGYGAPTVNPKAAGQSAYLIVGGKISEVEKQMIRTDVIKKTAKVSDGAGGLMDGEKVINLDIWVEPYVEGNTPMDEAFKKAEEFASKWVLEHPDNFPPIVINVTDGEPNDADAAEKAASALKNVATSDGNLLLFTAHISDGQGKIVLAASESAVPSPLGKLMFRLSSEIPASMIDLAKQAGFEEAKAGSRGLVVNGDASDMIKLIDFGSRTM
jgi:uncharacterized protein YegL